MERKGIPFTAMWLELGDYDAQYDPDYITETANTASSNYLLRYTSRNVSTPLLEDE